MSDLIEEFLDAKSVEDGVSINTLQAYRRDVKQFIELLSSVKIENICDEDLEVYLKKIEAFEYSPKTISRKISCIREFFKFLLSENIIRNNLGIIFELSIWKYFPENFKLSCNK